MAKTIVQHDEDPGIAIILYQDDEAHWGGQCTECGYAVRPDSVLMDVQQEAEIHIDQHESGL